MVEFNYSFICFKNVLYYYSIISCISQIPRSMYNEVFAPERFDVEKCYWLAVVIVVGYTYYNHGFYLRQKFVDVTNVGAYPGGAFHFAVQTTAWPQEVEKLVRMIVCIVSRMSPRFRESGFPAKSSLHTRLDRSV